MNASLFHEWPFEDKMVHLRGQKSSLCWTPHTSHEHDSKEMNAHLRSPLIENFKLTYHKSESLRCESSKGGNQKSGTLHADTVEAPKLSVCEHEIALLK